MWQSAIRTELTVSLRSTLAQLDRNLKQTREDSLPCYCYAKKSNSRTISIHVSQLVSADRQSRGQE